MPITRQAVTKHLKELEAAALLSSVKDGRETRYAATDGGFDAAAVWLASRFAAWDERLERIRDRAVGEGDA